MFTVKSISKFNLVLVEYLLIYKISKFNYFRSTCISKQYILRQNLLSEKKTIFQPYQKVEGGLNQYQY